MGGERERGREGGGGGGEGRERVLKSFELKYSQSFILFPLVLWRDGLWRSVCLSPSATEIIIGTMFRESHFERTASSICK